MKLVRKLFISLMILLGVLLLAFFCIYQNTSPRRMKNRYSQAEIYISHTDKDEDGIADNLDILENVLTYIETRPKYKSAYYASGYPNDGYGVCTDVVAFGLKGAGYDLMELLYKDVIENPEAYSISPIDKRIDFRRVRNLLVYFQRNAISLSTDIDDVNAWQPGDIVVFQGHIGIISDRRNKEGIAYVIHHANPFQLFYEEDILKQHDDILGHFRISE